MVDPLPSEKLKDVTYLLDRYGVTLAMCVFLAWVLHSQLKAMQWQLDRSIRNERAIMQKLNIPVILDGDKPAGP